MVTEQSSSESAPLLPIVAVLIGLATFSAMDAAMKGLVLALGAYNAILWRYAVGIILIGGVYGMRSPHWPSRAAMKVHLQRGVLIIFMAYLFMWGLGRVPLAEAIALSFIAPIIALYLAAIFLGETIERRAIWASLMGLGGVAVMVYGRLSGTYTQSDLMGYGAIFVSAFLYAGNLVIQRRQALLAGPIEIGFYQNLIVGSAYLLLAPFLAVSPSSTHWPLIFAAAVFAVISTVIMAWGYARAQAQVLINLEYSAFIWAAIFGWVFFSEPVTAPTILGTVLIVTGCILATRRGRPVAHIETTAI